MSTRRKDPRQAAWECRAAKLETDEKLSTALSNWIFSGTGARRILSLPGREWLWERRLSTTFNESHLHFLGVEPDKKIWREMRNTAEKLDRINKHQRFSAIPKPMDSAEYLRTTEHVFDMIYLDWMTLWIDKMEEQIVSIFARGLLNPGGLLRITAAFGSSRHASEPTYFWHSTEFFGFNDLRGGAGPNPEWFAIGFPGLIMMRAKELGVKLQMVSHSIYPYRESPKKRDHLEVALVFRLV